VDRTLGPRQILILFLLLTLILAPRPLAGYLDLEHATRLSMEQGAYLDFAPYYASAAERIPRRPDLYEQAGQAYLNGGSYPTAEQYFRLALQHHALTPEGWIAWGDALYAEGQFELAVLYWHGADAQADYSSAIVHERLGRGYEKMGDYVSAIAEYDMYLQAYPNDGPARYRLGLILAARIPEKALPELMQAAQLDPTLDARVQGLRTALNIAINSDDPAYRLVYSGQALGALGEWGLAEEAFRNAVAADPRSAGAWAWLAEARQQRGLDGGPQLQRALTLNPDLAMVQGLYGLYLQRQGRLEDARTAFLKASAREPGDAGWQLALGSLSEQSGDLIAALGYLTRAVALAPASAPAWRALASFSLRNNVELAATGLPAARRLIELAPDDWQSYDLAGQILLETGDAAGAEVVLKKAIELEPIQAAPALHLGLLYLQTGDGAQAYSYLNQALAFDPDGPYGRQAARLLGQYFP
jgi:tetratricopeptide (TPR) repeat protein